MRKRQGEGGSKTENKILLPNEGSFEVITDLGRNNDKVRRIGEAVSARKKVRASNMGIWVAVSELEVRARMNRGAKEKKAKQQPGGGARGKVGEIKEILDARGSMNLGDREYKVAWVGYGYKFDSWLPEHELFHASRLV